MNPIQLTIIVVVVLLILAVIVYYWYQEAKFRRMLENNFNQKTDDVLMEKNKTIIFGGKISEEANNSILPEKDIFTPSATTDMANNIFNQPNAQKHDAFFKEQAAPEEEISAPIEEVPVDSAEAFFVGIDKLPFPYKNELSANLDLIIDIVFEEPTKIKAPPEIAQYTHKSFSFYVLDKEYNWSKYEKGKKYVATGLKLSLQLVDTDGIVSHAQISNIYNELHRFVIKNHAHIRCNDYDAKLTAISFEMEQVNNLPLDLELYLITKTELSYSQISQFLIEAGFVESNTGFIYKTNDSAIFTITDENGHRFHHGNYYRQLNIVASLHHHDDPLSVVDTVFDFSEYFMEQFEARLLTANKLLLDQDNYDLLVKYVQDYVTSLNDNATSLGRELLKKAL